MGRWLRRWRCGLLLLGSALPAWASAMPSYAQVRQTFIPSDTWILSREGEPLQRVRTHMQVRRGEWVPLEATSSALRMALLVSEDQRFYAHSGVDWQAVSAAAWGNLWNSKTRGASTITMQLAGLLESDWRAGREGRNLGQKLGQAWGATQLERHWRKDQILEAYLNLLPFRGEIVGIDALSRSLFGKAPHALDAIEAAIAAALVRGPNASEAMVTQRACGVWQSVQQWSPTAAGALSSDCSVWAWRVADALAARRWAAHEGMAPHWAQWVLREAGRESAAPARITTTVLASVQRQAVAAVQKHLRQLQGRNVEDAAALVLDNATGQVLAWVGSSGGLSQAPHVDGVLAWRQPGSTLKPFLYAQALDASRLTAASLIEDSAAQIATPSGLYIPQNYDRRFKGWVSVRLALASSLNVPAVKTLVMVTPDAFFAQLRAWGLPLRENGGYYGYSLALGSAEVPLLHLTNAYRALANGGRYQAIASGIDAPGMSASAPAASQPVVSAGAAFIVGDILSDAHARAPTFGLDSELATRFWSAVKTGTSKDMRDNWAVGWSQRYTVGVWVGNASGEAMHGVSGSSGAAPIWADIMAALHAQSPSVAPQPPDGLVRQAVTFVASSPAQRVEPSRQEWFLAGTGQSEFHVPAASAMSAATGSSPRIASPTTGTIVALDPDIPAQRQLLPLRATHGAVWWVIGGKKVGQGPQAQWPPWPGRHEIQLQDAQQRVLDRVTVEVRGASVKPLVP